MTTVNMLAQAEALIAQWAVGRSTPEPDRLDITLGADHLQRAVAALNQAGWGYLAAITGVDEGEFIEVLYHFCKGPSALILRVPVSAQHPAVPTLYKILPSATIFEHELSQTFGIDVIGAPESTPSVLPDSWPLVRNSEEER